MLEFTDELPEFSTDVPGGAVWGKEVNAALRFA